jgi:hypothetical protein
MSKEKFPGIFSDFVSEAGYHSITLTVCDTVGNEVYRNRHDDEDKNSLTANALKAFHAQHNGPKVNVTFTGKVIPKEPVVETRLTEDDF